MKLSVHEAEEPLTENIALGVLNQAGATAGSDTGRDCRILADELGLLTIAINRTGSGLVLPSPMQRKRLTNDYVNETNNVSADVNRVLDDYGIDKLILKGRSAAALGVFALTSAGDLPVVAAQGEEIVALRRMRPRKTKSFYSNTLSYHKELIDKFDDYPDLVRPHPTDQKGFAGIRRAASIGYSFLVDQYHHTRAWCSSVGLEAAEDVAANHKDVYAEMLFADHSLTNLAAINGLSRHMSELRGEGELGIEPFKVQVIPNTIHASFDHHQLSAGMLRPLVATIVSRYG